MGRNTYGTMAVVQAEVAHDEFDMDEPSASRFTQLVCNDDASLLPEGCRSRHHHLVVRLRAGSVNCGRVIDDRPLGFAEEVPLFWCANGSTAESGGSQMGRLQQRLVR